MPRPVSFELPTRQIHLDFHTSPHIKDVGQDFNAKEFAAAMKRAHVNSVTVFAKCHHGHLYYNTNRAERHPGLKKNFDLLALQVEALHRENIRAPIYISIQCDEYAADTHPEWIAREVDGKPVGGGPFDPKGNVWPVWQIMDMSSPYQEYLAEQTREILKLFKPADGIFFDMCWDQPSCSNDAIDGMVRKNLNPELEADRDRYSHEVSLAYMKRFFAMVKDASPNASVYFNGRALANLSEEIAYQSQNEIEALPTGGWGYLYFPKNVRYARRFNRPYMGMTARFHKSWADFGGLKPFAALHYETSQMIAHGACCSIGDQLHPRGTLDPAAYDLIGRAYQRVEAREPWLKNAKPVAEIGVFLTTDGKSKIEQGPDEGALRALTSLRHQFNFVRTDSDLTPYRLLILPDAVTIDEALAKKLRAHLSRGGSIFASGHSGISPDGATVTMPEWGIKSAGISPFLTTYLQFGKRIAQDVPPTHHVMYERGLRVIPLPGAISHGVVVEPYFDRSWRHFSSHFQTPSDHPTKFSIAVQNKNCIYVAYPIFTAIAKHASPVYRMLVRNLVDLLLPDPILKVGGPTGLETSITRQGNRDIIHLLFASPERRAKDLDLIEDILPLTDLAISFKRPKPPTKVSVVPDGVPIPFVYRAGRVEFTLPRLDGHAMICVE